jgi:hypothetical protein
MRVSAYGISAVVGVLCLCSLAIVLSQAMFSAGHARMASDAHSMTPEQERNVIRSAESMRQRRAVQVLSTNLRPLLQDSGARDAALASEQEAFAAAAASLAAAAADRHNDMYGEDDQAAAAASDAIGQRESPAAYRNAKDAVNSLGAADAAVALGNDAPEEPTEGVDGAPADGADGLAPSAQQERGELIVGILTDPESLRSLGMASYTTWARDLEPHFTVSLCVSTDMHAPLCLHTRSCTHCTRSLLATR